jgi:polyisoprenoid-binding protein YceI
MRFHAAVRRRSCPLTKVRGMRFMFLAALLSAVSAAASLSAASLHFNVEPSASSVTFAVRVNIGIDSFVGHVDQWSLDLTMSADSDLPDHAVFTANVTELKTGKDKRDSKMREWLESDVFPTVRFELRTARRSGAGLEADGDLAIHGKTKSVTIPITLEHDGTRLTVRGAIAIDTRDFDLEIIRMAGFVSVKPTVEVAFVATGALQ